MAVTTRLQAYLRLERVMLDLDEAADPLADHLRDLMDPLWYGLTDEEHAFLDARSAPPAVVGLTLNVAAIRSQMRIVLPSGPLMPLGRAA